MDIIQLIFGKLNRYVFLKINRSSHEKNYRNQFLKSTLCMRPKNYVKYKKTKIQWLC